MPHDQQAEAIAAAVRAGDGRRVVAPGGMGKTWLLADIARRLDDTPITWWSPAIDPDAPPPDTGVLLADDVHLADPERLRGLARRGRVVAAHRPAEGPAARVLDALDGAPLVLGPLGAGQVHALLAARWGRPPDPARVEAVVTATGGNPRLVLAVAGDLPVDAVTRTASLDEVVRSERQQLDAAARALLDAAAVLAGLDLSLLAAACDLDLSTAAAAAARLAAAGLAHDATPHLAPVVADAVRTLVPASVALAIVDRAATATLATGPPDPDVAERIRASGVAGGAAAGYLLHAARAVLDEAPDQARRWTDAAAAGDAEPGDLAALRALAAARAGDVETTVSAVDTLLRTDAGWRRSPLRREAVETAAAVLARQGVWTRSAELAEAVGPDSDHAVATAATARLALGEADRVRAVVHAHRDAAPPGMQAAASGTLARGLAETLSQDPAAALPLLLEAAQLGELSPPSIPLPEAPDTLAAVVACHLWEFDMAAQILDHGAQRFAPGDDAGDGARRELLRAWVAMRRGDWVPAVAMVEQTRRGATLDLRGMLVANAVEAGVARRRGDLETMQRTWRASRSVLLRLVPDLPLLQPIGELVITGARLGDRGTVRLCRNRVGQVLDRAGRPPLWTLSPLWDDLHTAIALDDTPAARVLAKTADAIAAGAGRAATIAGAARCWVDALDGDADPRRVRRAARGLADAGLTWEGARLAGAAAIRIADSGQMRDLLQFARGLTTERAPVLGETVGELSPRERDVAIQLLTGQTYREIGAQLFIAPKTVEHHVASIRRKLGARSRTELLLTLRRHVSTATR